MKLKSNVRAGYCTDAENDDFRLLPKKPTLLVK